MKYQNIFQTGSSNVTGSAVLTLNTFHPSEGKILQGAQMGIWVQSVHLEKLGNPKGDLLHSQQWKQDANKKILLIINYINFQSTSESGKFPFF